MAATTALGLTACLPTTTSTVYLHADDPLVPYSASVLSSHFCFVSGTTGAATEDFENEASSALDGLERELGRAGLTLSELVQVTVYLTDLEDYATFDEIYAARVPEPYPARAVAEVTALPGQARVEIHAIARRR